MVQRPVPILGFARDGHPLGSKDPQSLTPVKGADSKRSVGTHGTYSGNLLNWWFGLVVWDLAPWF